MLVFCGGLPRSSVEAFVMGVERRGQRPLGIPTVEDRVAQMVVVMYIAPRLEAIFHDDSYGYRPMNESNLQKNLYKLWNRMSSGSYFPKAVKLVEIPKPNGGKRPLGIPTVEDRVAQMVVVMYIAPCLEAIFHDDSYGYRPMRSAHSAIAKAIERCNENLWVLDMDISKFFDWEYLKGL